MAQTKKTNTGRRSSNGRKGATGTSYNRKTSTSSRNKRPSEPMDSAIRSEIWLIALFAVSVFLFLCNFGIIGVVGDAISNVMFGIFGMTAYVMPVALFLMIAFGTANSGNSIATRKLIAGVVLFLVVGMIFELFTKMPQQMQAYSMSEIYKACSEAHNGGGVIAGSLAYLCYHFMGIIGTVLVILVVSVIAIVVLTEKSFVSGVKSGGRKVYERTREDARYRREQAAIRRQEQEEARRLREEERLLREEELENEKILRMDKKVSGVMMDTTLTKEEEKKDKVRDDIHEINIEDFEEKVEEAALHPASSPEDEFDFSSVRINGMYRSESENESDALSEITEDYFAQEPLRQGESYVGKEEPMPVIHREQSYDDYGREHRIVSGVHQEPEKPKAYVKKNTFAQNGFDAEENVKQEVMSKPEADENIVVPRQENKPPKKYIFPPLSKLQKGSGKTGGDSERELRETAKRLQQTLQTFGVKVTITDISQGPSVTRYELQPEQGVKVSKIVGLTDDIKLNLAATDIRMEAPIPGKAAIGIEVPNKENSAVALRDLLESKEFKEFPSNIAFAVGKDIAGKTVVADIAKMPHMLIAGATGSGKSVCINTLIMSILYKAHPDDVKLIMVDPKVVELSVYNGIPHLLIPVVTDPKKAAGALHWGVAEMTDRYQKFADYNVRDLKGYNQKVEEMRAKGDENAPAKMPQIVIIVDELADLMMVAPGEVEESICRLAQLARACGIHLIIATQRPSVDVITGLIKANMPSRVAFSVSSGVDSRTILDMNGAEKLLGKGDMLFYPQGYSKPARVQGAFVSDKEVSDVVEFLKNQALGNVYSSDIQEKIANIGSSASSASGAGDDGSERDQYFVDAAKFIIDKDKASIGMLQRVFKIGFNRAARIMDQLCEAGVVGEEEGTKPRKVLMSMEQFEQYIDECL